MEEDNKGYVSRYSEPAGFYNKHGELENKQARWCSTYIRSQGRNVFKDGPEVVPYLRVWF